MKKIGRPTKYRRKYCRQVVEFMSQGGSIVSFAGTIGVSKQRVYDWSKRYPDFRDAYKRGKAAALCWWETLGTLGVMGKIPHFNAHIWIIQMRNRFGWRNHMTVDTEFDEILRSTNNPIPQI